MQSALLMLIGALFGVLFIYHLIVLCRLRRHRRRQPVDPRRTRLNNRRQHALILQAAVCLTFTLQSLVWISGIFDQIPFYKIGSWFFIDSAVAITFLANINHVLLAHHVDPGFVRKWWRRCHARWQR